MRKTLADPLSNRYYPALANFRNKVIFCVGGGKMPGNIYDGATTMYNI